MLGAAREVLASGVKALCVISAGFAETGAEGAARQDELLALVRAHGARLVGPNCLGIASTATQAERDVRPSCAACRADRLLVAERRARAGVARRSRRARARALELRLDRQQGRRVVERPARVLGGGRRVGSDPALPRVVREPAEVRAGRGPSRALEADSCAAERHEPRRRARGQLAYRGARRLGRGGRGALLAGGRPSRVDARGAARRGRAVLDSAAAARQPRRGRDQCRRARHLCADACDGAGLELPPLAEETKVALRQAIPEEASLANPVDLLGSATAATYEAVLPALLADPGIDAVIALFVPPVVATAVDVAGTISRVAKGAEKPVLPVVMSADGCPPGAFAYPESAARALGLAARRAAWLRRPAGVVPDLDRIDRAAAARDHRSRRACHNGRRLARAARGSRTCSRRMACRWSRSGTPRRPKRPRTPLPRWAFRSSSRPPRRAPTRPSLAASISTCVTARAWLAQRHRSAGRSSSRPYVTEGAELLAGRDPGPGLRAARRVRSRRGLRRADRLDPARPRTPHRSRRCRARRERQGGPSGCRLARSSTGRCGRPGRRAASAGATRRASPRGGRARSESRPRRAGAVRRGRRPRQAHSVRAAPGRSRRGERGPPEASLTSDDA